MKKIIYIATLSLIPHIHNYLRIQEVIDSGFEVEYWDLTDIYYKGQTFPAILTKEYVRRIDSLYALKERLTREDLKRTIFVLQVHYELMVLSLYLVMSRLDCKIVYFPYVPYTRKPLAIRIMDELRPAKFWRACLNVIAIAIKKMGFVKKYDLVFAAGRLARDAYKDHDRVVNINYLDYDQCLASRNRFERIVQYDYAVFLDEGCVDNPNVKYYKMVEMDPEMFYGSLRRFFDHIERSFNLKVVIAAHPGILYDRSIIFGNREVYEGKTRELVRYASLVISQSSTATSFAVFYKKPLMFVYTDEYALIRGLKILEFLARELGAPSYNIDLAKELGPLEAPVINHVLYDNYKYTNYTSEETQDISSEKIIVKSLMEL
jgi:hypothetical protein